MNNISLHLRAPPGFLIFLIKTFNPLLSRYFKQISQTKTNNETTLGDELISQGEWSTYKLFWAPRIYCGYYKHRHTSFWENEVSSRSKLGLMEYPQTLSGIWIWVRLNAQSPEGLRGGENSSRNGYSWGNSAARRILCIVGFSLWDLILILFWCWEMAHSIIKISIY